MNALRFNILALLILSYCSLSTDGQVIPVGKRGERKWLRQSGHNGQLRDELTSTTNSNWMQPSAGLTNLMPFNASAQAQRVVVKCKKSMDQDLCLQAIIESNTDHHVLQVIHKLNRVNSIVVKIQPSHMNELTMLGFEIRQDPVRRPLHIQESLRYNHRLLPNNNNGLGGAGHPSNKNTQQIPYGIGMVRAMDSWAQFGVRGRGVKVCMVDSGIDASHEDFASYQLNGNSAQSFLTPWSIDAYGHGTHTSGTINAKNNTLGVVGVAPQADMYIVRVLDNQGNFYGSDLVAAAEACASAGAKIISMSLGGPSYDPNEAATFQALYNQGILAIAAGGNDGDTSYNYPASYDIVIGVAAVDSTKSHAYFSNANDKIDFAAPGECEIVSKCRYSQLAEILTRSGNPGLETSSRCRCL